MKSTLISRITAFGLLALSTELLLAQNVNLNQLPAAVQREAQTELKNGPIKQVQSLQQNGRTIYQITYQRADGTAKNIYLNPDGTYVQNQGAPAATATGQAQGQGQQIQFSQLPQAVQRTIRTETKNGPVGKIQQLSQNGSVVYEVFFNEPNGQQKIVYLNPDGSYVQNSGSLTTGSRVTHSWDALGTGSAAMTQPLLSTRQVSFSQLPAAVQNTIKTQAGQTLIENIQQGQLNGQTVYQAAINRNGRIVQLRVDSAGTVLGTSQAVTSSVPPQP